MMQTKTELDEIDLRILEVLQQEGRLSNRELSERVFLSASQCLRRTKRLEQSGVIRGYAALLNPGRIGLGVRAFVNVSLEKHGQDPAAAFSEAIQSWEEVLECWAVTGEGDYLLRVAAPTLEEFSNLLMHKLLALPMVASVRSSLLLQECKHTTALPLGHLQSPR